MEGGKRREGMGLVGMEVREVKVEGVVNDGKRGRDEGKKGSNRRCEIRVESSSDGVRTEGWKRGGGMSPLAVKEE